MKSKKERARENQDTDVRDSTMDLYPEEWSYIL